VQGDPLAFCRYPFAPRDDDAAKPDHVLALHGLSDHREGFLRPSLASRGVIDHQYHIAAADEPVPCMSSSAISRALVPCVSMIDEEQLTELTAWLAGAGLAGEPELALVIGFCERTVAAGLPLARARVLIDTLDPVHEGRVFRWGYDTSVPPEQEYGRTTQIVASGTVEPAFVLVTLTRNDVLLWAQLGRAIPSCSLLQGPDQCRSAIPQAAVLVPRRLTGSGANTAIRGESRRYLREPIPQECTDSIDSMAALR
jgi:hypothetical protein